VDKNLIIEEIIGEEEAVEAIRVQEGEVINMEINKTRIMVKINNKGQSINNNNSEKYNPYQILLHKQ
jgi:hypothetical protein